MRKRLIVSLILIAFSAFSCSYKRAADRQMHSMYDLATLVECSCSIGELEHVVSVEQSPAYNPSFDRDVHACRVATRRPARGLDRIHGVWHFSNRNRFEKTISKWEEISRHLINVNGIQVIACTTTPPEYDYGSIEMLDTSWTKCPGVGFLKLSIKYDSMSYDERAAALTDVGELTGQRVPDFCFEQLRDE